LIALSYLPISKKTLKYGSHDGGATVHADDSELNEQMKAVGTFLNLEGHHVGTQTKTLYLCGDIEGHIGFDDQLYCLDFARVFPPEKLPASEKKWEKSEKNTYLFKLLRPELVKANPVPLNSDARSRFIRSDLYPEEFKTATKQVQYPILVFIYQLLRPLRASNRLTFYKGGDKSIAH